MMSDAQSHVDISIVTPSFNMLAYLRRCSASIADQTGPAHQHIVVDALSSDGTLEWLREAPDVTGIFGKDAGMYDAINKGLRVAQGEIVSYLSCDEQYLPGTFAFVKAFFDRHPEVDGIFGDTLVTRPDGTLLSFRKSYRPIWPLILASHLYVFPCSMFLRRRFIDEGELFEARYKDVGDTEFVVRLLRKGYRLRNVRRYFSTFTLTGSNRSQQLEALNELSSLRQATPPWVRRLRGPLNLARLAFKLASGCYFERPPLEYELYTPDVGRGRRTFCAQHVTPRWRTA
jgi:glycosyltransferase involved in cell wall biosynthesis